MCIGDAQVKMLSTGKFEIESKIDMKMFNCKPLHLKWYFLVS